MKILLIEDDTATRRLLGAVLDKLGHEVIHAVDGVDGWQKLLLNQVSFVLIDWLMPNMSGVEFCQKLRNSELEYYVYTVLFTGKDQLDDMVIAMEAGADDFLTKPVQARELEVSIAAGKRVLDLEASLKQQNTLLESANQKMQQTQQRIKRDLNAAAKVQQDLLPKSEECGLPVNVAWDFAPAEELAGDLFNFFKLDSHHLGFYLADVCGHGIPAAMLAVQVARMLTPDAHQDSLIWKKEAESFGLGNAECLWREPAEILALLNARFQDSGQGQLYFTMLYGVLDTHTGQVKMCQAGHPYPLVLRSNGQFERLGNGGLPVGLMPEVEYDQIEFVLQPEDRLLMYSDGLTECRNAENEMFGIERLQSAFCDSGETSLNGHVAHIKRCIATWSGTNAECINLDDDASLLMLERQAPGGTNVE